MSKRKLTSEETVANILRFVEADDLVWQEMILIKSMMVMIEMLLIKIVVMMMMMMRLKIKVLLTMISLSLKFN